MENEEEINAKILKITLSIQGHYPELSWFLLGKANTFSKVKNPEIRSKILKEYFESLENYLIEYIENEKFVWLNI
jgi:hypothetical protein